MTRQIAIRYFNIIKDFRTSISTLSLLQNLQDLGLIPGFLKPLFSFGLKKLLAVNYFINNRLGLYYFWMFCRIVWQLYTIYGLLMISKNTWTQTLFFYVVSAALTFLVIYLLKNQLYVFVQKLKNQKKVPELKVPILILLIFMLGLELVTIF